MKKKIIIGIVIAILVIAVGVGAYFIIKNANKNNNNNSSQAPRTEVVGKVTKTYNPNTNNEIVYTYLEAKVDGYTDEDGRGIYSVPQINLDSKYAKDVNEEILLDFETILDSYNTDGNLYTAAESAKYFYYKNGDILSLVIESLTDNENFNTYLIFNINTVTGEKVPNAELLNEVNLSELDFSYNLVEKLSKLTDGATTSKKSQIQKSITIYKNKKINEYEMYINGEGTLSIIAGIYATDEETSFSEIIDF